MEGRKRGKYERKWGGGYANKERDQEYRKGRNEDPEDAKYQEQMEKPEDTQEVYRNKVEYYRNQFPNKGNMKGKMEEETGTFPTEDDETEPWNWEAHERAKQQDAGMEGSSNQNPHIPMYLEFPQYEQGMNKWQPPSPPKIPLSTEPKAPAWKKGKENMQEREQRPIKEKR